MCILRPPKDTSVDSFSSFMILRFSSRLSCSLIALTLSVQAAEFSSDSASRKKKDEDREGGAGDWCDTLQDFGRLYKEKKKTYPSQFIKTNIMIHYFPPWVVSLVTVNNVILGL